MNARLRPLRDGDIGRIAADARPADIAEMAALGLTFTDALADSIARSHWTAVGEVDGVPVCVFGVAPTSLLGGIGAPWMLGARGLDRARTAFIRACPRVMEAFLATYPRLANVVDARNAQAIRWLRWLGFTVLPDGQRVGDTRFLPFFAGAW